MSEYTFIVGNRGHRYMKNGKFVKADLVPEEVVMQLKEHKQTMVVSDGPAVIDDGSNPIPYRECLFCGQFGTCTRFINLQTIYLCEEHYYDMDITVGKIAEKVRKLTNVVQSLQEA